MDTVALGGLRLKTNDVILLDNVSKSLDMDRDTWEEIGRINGWYNE